MDRSCAGFGTLRTIACMAFACFIAACGGGGGDSDGATTATPPTAPPLATTPTISWVSTLSENQSRIASLTVGVPITTSGIKQVDFFVDGVLVATGTNGAKQPGVPLLLFSTAWNTASYADGPHALLARVTDNANLTAETPTKIVTLKNNISIPVALATNQVFPAPASAATGSGQLAVNLATGAIGGDIVLTNMTATAVHLHAGSPTVSGTNIVTLSFDSATARWIIPTNTTLTSFGSFSQVYDLLAGSLYVDAHSTTYPDGEVRAQLLMPAMSLVFGSLLGNQEVPPVSSQGSGIVSVLENRSTNSFQINARTTGLGEVVSIGVYSVPGPASLANWLFFLRPDTNGNLTASGSLLTDGYNTGTWFANVTTRSHTSGEIGGLLPVIDHSLAPE